MAGVAAVHKISTPGGGELLCPLEGAIRVIAAAQQLSGKRQFVHHHWPPAFERGLQLFALRVAGADQKCGFHAVGVLRMLGPGGGKDATQAVRHQYHRRGRGQYGLFELHHPVAPQGLHPVVLLHTGEAVQRLPAALPVGRAGVLPAGQKEDSRVGHGCYEFRSYWGNKRLGQRRIWLAMAPTSP